MVGMNFGGFLTLLILGFIAAIVIHSIIRYRMLEGLDGFLVMWIAGWIGGWLGSSVLGHWSFQIQNIYVSPAVVGAFVGAFSFAAMLKANSRSTADVMAPQVIASGAVPDMVRKAS
jgi:uncharacterized membrane protein YeaQ/YmgE (transglycosylase-associated protein family)